VKISQTVFGGGYFFDSHCIYSDLCMFIFWYGGVYCFLSFFI